MKAEPFHDLAAFSEGDTFLISRLEGIRPRASRFADDAIAQQMVVKLATLDFTAAAHLLLVLFRRSVEESGPIGKAAKEAHQYLITIAPGVRSAALEAELEWLHLVVS